MITLQYLEPGHHITGIQPNAAQTKLRAAFEILPIDALLIGWDIPEALEDVCKAEADQYGVKLYRWHPLLCSDGSFSYQAEWCNMNLRGGRISGFHGLPEFTFLCPNHPVAREIIQKNISGIAQSSFYDGIFLDRMRFSSPSQNPIDMLACFCDHCYRESSAKGLELKSVQQSLQKNAETGYSQCFLQWGVNFR